MERGWVKCAVSGHECPNATGKETPARCCLAPELPSKTHRSLAILADDVSGCRRCPHGSTRKQSVLAKGDPLSTLAFLGEAPGADEDEQGLPFVGSAGQLLDKQIDAMRRYAEAEHGITFPSDPYVCNVVKCRPSDNKLLKDENDVRTCADAWLWQQLRLLPKLRVVVALGRVAAQTLTASKLSIGALRDSSNLAVRQMGVGVAGLMLDLKKLDKPEIKVIPTYHPSYLLRQPNRKDLRLAVWSDLKLAVEVSLRNVSLR